MRRTLIKRGALVAILIVAAAAVWLFALKHDRATFTLQTETPQRGYISQSVTATGKVEPVDTVSVGTQVSGIIKSLYVDFNSRVKKGQLIAELDESLLRATLDQDKATLQNAQSQLTLQKNNFSRQDQLYKIEAISKADHDSAVYALEAAKASVANAQAQVRSAAKNLSYAYIYSPIDGIVLFRNISPGQTVASAFSTPTLFIIARDIKKMDVEADVDEADIGDVKAGDRATFTVEAFIDQTFKGTVEQVRLHPGVSANVVTYTTIVNAPNDSMKLKPGMTANIIIYTHEVNDALLIPSRALGFKPDSAILKNYTLVGNPTSSNEMTQSSGTSSPVYTVWVLSGKTLIRKVVTIGLNDNLHAQVLNGLSATDQVVMGEVKAGVNNAASSSGSPFLPKHIPGGGRTR